MLDMKALTFLVQVMAKLCARGKAAAKRKFKVYPSAYANAFAAKRYKAMGGGWRSS